MGVGRHSRVLLSLPRKRESDPRLRGDDTLCHFRGNDAFVAGMTDARGNGARVTGVLND